MRLNLLPCVAALWLASASSVASMDRPNVVLLLADDLGSGDLGCYGGPVKTPNLDLLARRGVRMTDFHAGAAVCSPSRATWLTGRHHIRAGIYTVLQDHMHKAHLLEREVTIAEVLRQAGYETAHFGKWHLGMSSRNRSKPSPTEHGFDYWFGLSNGAHPSHRNPVNFLRNGEPVGPLEGYSCQILVDDATRWIEERSDSERPFFLNVCFNEPHSVIAAPEEIVSLYGNSDDQAAVYSATIDNTDRAIGRLMNKLRSRGELDDTLIFFASDHGSYRQDRNLGLRGDKGSNFEGGLRSPGIFFWPKGFAGNRSESEPSGAVDLLPTICGLLDIEKPKGVHLDGADLSPLLKQRGDFLRRQLLYWHLPTSGPAAAVRDGQYALVAYRDYRLPRDHTTLNAILRRIAELVSVDENDGGGNLRNRVFNSMFSHPEATRLRRLYVQLSTFQESWIPVIKAGGFGRFELYDLSADPKQKHDIAAERPELTSRLKKQLLAIHKSVMADAPEWLTAEGIAREKKARRDLANSFSRPIDREPKNLGDLWERIEARPLPEGYHGSRHQAFVDRQLQKMTPEQRGRVGRLWRERQEAGPAMSNRGATFVRILMYVAGGKQGEEPSKPWFRARSGAALPLVKSTESFEVRAKPGHPTLLSPHADPIAIHGPHLFVVNTPADTLEVIDTETKRVIARIPVGIDPVCARVRPDGREVWVSNHISDTVSVIDNDAQSPTYLTVVATIQDINLRRKSTRFDEPSGIAFAGNAKAYVALSSTNRVAIIDVASRRVIEHLRITAQEPRLLRVHDGRLYVVPFESGNQTQLSGGNAEDIDGHRVTFDAEKLAASFDSAGFTVDIVKHPDIPDRDLYVFDTETDELIEAVSSLGTLLYGFDVAADGTVLIAHTEARNHINGRSGTRKHGLRELENRPYLNRVARVSASGHAEFFQLNPPPPEQPDRQLAIATPSAVHVDAGVAYVTAAGSDHLILLDVGTGEILARHKVGSVPRGVLVQEREGGRVRSAWVFNSVDNSVSEIDVSTPKSPSLQTTIALEDPTSARDKAGLAAFHTARASSNGTFSCASCHPDGHTDQLLWVLDTPHIVGADQVEPRLSQTLRGLRGTAPYHWDGIPGDPYGGPNASTRDQLKPNCDSDDLADCVRHLIDGSMATTMLQHGSDVVNDEGKRGYLSAAERDAMAEFLLNLSHKPPRARAYTDELSMAALTGFERFHVTGNRDRKNRNTMVCGSCHTLPYLASDQDSMNVPSFRGALDRHITQAQARNSVISLGGIQEIAEQGWPAEAVWKRMLHGDRGRLFPVIDMFKEAGTGFSGAFGKQLTICQRMANAPLVLDLLPALEKAAIEGTVVLRGSGELIRPKSEVESLELVFDSGAERYVTWKSKRRSYTRDQLLKLAASGELVATFTAYHPSDALSAPPAIWTAGSLHEQRGIRLFPRMDENRPSMRISGRYVQDGAALFVGGRRVHGSIRAVGGELFEVSFGTLPERGMNTLQVQNPNGYSSNEFIFFVETEAEAVQRYESEPAYLLTAVLNSAIVNDNVEAARIALRAGADLNMPHELFEFERQPLILAAMYGRARLVKELIRRGAELNIQDKNGLTALHEAARLCREEICRTLLAAGARADIVNKKGKLPLDLTNQFVREEHFERYFAPHRVNLTLDHQRYLKSRPIVQRLLRKHEKRDG